MTDTAKLTVLELAALLGQTASRTIVKPMHQLESVGPDGTEQLETGLIRVELPMPGYIYIRESSYTRYPEEKSRVSFSRATSFVRRDSSEEKPEIVDEAGAPVTPGDLCSLLDSLPFLQHYDLAAFEQVDQPHGS